MTPAATRTALGPSTRCGGFAEQITDHLVRDHDVKLVIVACNTAAATGLAELQARVDVPVLGVIEPGVRSLAKATHRGRVGVIGTVGTVALRRVPGGGRPAGAHSSS